MQITPFPPGLCRFSLDALTPQLWANGCGLTREISAGALAPGDAPWDWRFSVADIGGAGPFSRLDGIDRCAALVDGAGLALASTDSRLSFDAVGDVRAFAGETALVAHLGGGPARLFNAMARRGRAQVRVAPLHGHASLVTHRSHHDVLVVARGEFEVSLRQGYAAPVVLRLQAGEGIALRDMASLLDLHALGHDACALHATAMPAAH